MELVAKKSLGLSFTTNGVTFTEVTKTFGRVRVARTGVLPLPTNSGANGHVHPEENGDAHHSGNFWASKTPDEVIVGLPAQTFLLRFLELPDLPDAELNSLLSYELDRHLPFPSEEAWYGFQKLGRSCDKALVMLTVARRADVEPYLAMVEKIGFHPTAVSASPIAALNAYLFYQTQTQAGVHSVIYLNGKEAAISVIRDGVLLSSRSVFLREGSSDAVFTELQRIARTIDGAPGKVFVTGDDAELCRRLKDELTIPVEEWRLFWPSANVSAFGLALAGVETLPLQINLLPAERRQVRRERSVTLMFALFALFGILGCALGFSYAYQERQTLRLLDSKVTKIKADAASLAVLRGKFVELEDKVRFLDGLRERQEQPLAVLKELAQLLPPGVLLHELSLQNDKLRIRGGTSSSASELISVLERSKKLENAAFTSAISSRGKDRQDFHIEVSVKRRFPVVKRRPEAVKK